MRFALLGALALVCAAPVSAAVVASGNAVGIFSGGTVGPAPGGSRRYTFELSAPDQATINSVILRGSINSTVYTKVPGGISITNDFAQYGCSEGFCGGSVFTNPVFTDRSIAVTFNVYPSSGDPASCNDPAAPLGLCYFAVSNAGFSFGAMNPGNAALTWTISADAVSVPEPSTWALMISGFGLVGSFTRRRRRRSHPISV